MNWLIAWLGLWSVLCALATVIPIKRNVTRTETDIAVIRVCNFLFSLTLIGVIAVLRS